MKTILTPKENMLRAIHHENPEWIPMATDERIFTPHIIPDNIARGWIHEQKPWAGSYGGPDMFGIPWIYMEEAGGSMVQPGAPVLEYIEDWKEVITFPDPDSWDWKGCAAENRKYLHSEYFVESWIFTGLFERLISWMDFENALVALIDEEQKEYVHEIFRELTVLYKKIIKNLRQYCNIDSILFHDDWGTQKAPFFSPAMAREMIAPYIHELADYCHSIGVVFDMHSCGRLETMIPVFVECGIDKWDGQNINDKLALIMEYGDKFLIGATDTLSSIEGISGMQQEAIDAYIRGYLKEYASKAPSHLFYLVNRKSSPVITDRFYELSKKLLAERQGVT